MRRKGYSVLSEHPHPDRRVCLRYLCQFRKERAGLAGTILSPASAAGRDLCQCPGAQGEPVGIGGTAPLRDGPGRDLGTFCQPACRPGGQRNHGCGAQHLRESRARCCGPLAVVERGPGIPPAHPSLRHGRSTASREDGGIRVLSLVSTAVAGRARRCLFLVGGAAAGSRPRRGLVPSFRDQVQRDHPPGGGRRAAHRRPGF